MDANNKLSSSMTAGVLALGLMCTSVANAATVTYILDNANWKSLLPDGENYATVMIDDSGGTINFTIEVNPLILTENPDASYGINTFSFNNLGLRGRTSLPY